MHIKKLMKIMKKDEGSGLILALMTLMVLSVLGASLGMITIGSYKLGDVNRNDNSAYYIAEAGANMAYEEFNEFVNSSYKDNDIEINFYTEVKNYISTEVDDNLPKIQTEYTEEFSFQFGSKPKAVIEVTENTEGNPREYTIVSTGIIEGRERSVQKDVTVNWIGKSNDGPGSAIPAITTTVARNSIYIGTGVDIAGTIHIDGSDFIPTNESEFPLEIHSNITKKVTVLVPEGMVKDSVMLGTDDNVEILNRTEPLNWKIYEDLINDFPVYPLELYVDDIPAEIKTNGQHITYVTDKLENSFEITGGGRVDIFVRDSIAITNNSVINGNGKTEQLQVFYKEPKDGSSISIGNNAYFNGTLFSDKADFNFQGNVTLSGLFITGAGLHPDDIGKVSLGGGAINALIIAPYADITFDNSSNDNTINGIMVGENVKLRNNMTLIYSDEYLKNFPLQLPDPESDGSGDGSGGSGGGELIVTEPGIEN